MTPEWIRRIAAHYPTASAWERFHLRQRLKWCPYDTLLEYLPVSGKLLDLGCGFGHFGWFLAETRPELEYWGCDPDGRKISLATASGLARVFRGDARAWPDLPRDFSAVVLLDVLYLLTLPLQGELLDFARDRLARRNQSALLLKILPPLRGWPRLRTWAQERLMVGWGKTLSSGSVASAQDPGRYAEWAARRGMKCREIPLPTSPASTLLVFNPGAEKD